jgi:hypothetical protein
VNELDETVAWVRAHGPAPLPVDGWDRASIWGWDHAANSLYAHLWRNTDDPARPPAIRIGPDHFTPAITFPETLALHIAMAIDRDPWEVDTAMDESARQSEDCTQEDKNASNGDVGTAVTMTERHGIWWPPNIASKRNKT